MTVARMTLTTWGDPVAKSQWQSPVVLAEDHPNHGPIQSALDDCRERWRSAPGLTASAAIEEAGHFIIERLEVALRSSAVNLLLEEALYQPIRNENGDIVGHDTITLLLVNDKPVPFSFAKSGWPRVEGFVAIIIGVERQ